MPSGAGRLLHGYPAVDPQYLTRVTARPHEQRHRSPNQTASPIVTHDLKRGAALRSWKPVAPIGAQTYQDLSKHSMVVWMKGT
jgi:hypothetical protein